MIPNASSNHPLAAAVRDLLPDASRTTFHILAADDIDSTNTALKTAAREMQSMGDAIRPTVLLARRQSGGRGRLGRSFHSPAGTGLYMSILLVPDMPPQNALYLTTAAAAACAAASETLRASVLDASAADLPPVGIKWVNDLYLDGRKICGILAEASLTPTAEALAWAVIGIGINILPPDGGFPDDIAASAGSLLPGGCVHAGDTDNITARLCADILTAFTAALQPQAAGTVLDAYRRRSVLDGRRITLRPASSLGGEEILATALGISDDFGLRVRYDDGREAVLSSGEAVLCGEGDLQSARTSVHLS